MEQTRHILLREFETRRLRNSAYSLRAFARDLCISPASLSQVLNSKRKFSFVNAKKAALNLKLSRTESEQFLGEAAQSTPVAPAKISWKVLREDQFKLVADWYYFAILNLAMIPSCKSDPNWIAKRLNLDVATVKIAVERLVRMGRLTVQGSKLVRNEDHLSTSEDIPSSAIQQHHMQKLELAKRALGEFESAEREILSLTFPFSPERLGAVKRMIRRFAETVTNQKGQAPSEVYTLNIQFFPLSRKISKT